MAASLVVSFASTPASATTVVAPAFASLVSQADYIVRAVVKSVSAELHTNGQNRHIITKVELDVRQVISGTPPQPLILVMLGGKVGQDEMVVDGAPKFQVGDEDILFIRGNGKNFNPLVALMHGRYPILHDSVTGRDYVARSNGAPLYNEQDVSLPFAAVKGGALAERATPALSPEDFASRIRAALPSTPTQQAQK